FRPCLRLVLVQMSKMTLAGFTYRGLSPHEFTPMPGVHQTLKRTRTTPGAFGGVLFKLLGGVVRAA
ncbi:MAG: hypothetical protein V2B18_20995, partial [Pseudomonadota bacterium]